MAQAGDRLGMKPRGSLPRVVNFAKERGWIVSRTGNEGGLYPAAAPPAEPDAKAA